ncbi:MAG: hypothetical protein AB2L22_13290 [Syntrophales bacterium]
MNNDPINDILGKNDGLDPFGPYSREEHKVEDVSGIKIATRQIHLEQTSPDGTRHLFTQTQYLCQCCSREYVTLGQTALIVDNNILCARCSRMAKIKRVLRFLTSPFVKMPDDKQIENRHG